MIEEDDLTPVTIQEFVSFCPVKAQAWLMTVMEDASRDMVPHWSRSENERKEALKDYIIVRTKQLPYLDVYQTISFNVTIKD